MERVVRIITRLNRGGPLRQLEALVPRLAAVGYDGPLLVGQVEPHETDGRARLLESGAEIIDVPSMRRGVNPIQDRRSLRILVAHLQRLRPAIVHTHLGKAGALGRVAAHRAGVPCVHTLHGHHFCRSGWLGRLARMAERRLVSRTSAWVALSASQRDDLAQVIGADAAARIHVVSPGLEVERFAGLAAASSCAGRILWTGRMVPVKRVDVLLGAFERMTQSATLTLAGGGPGLAATRAAVAAHPRAAQISVLGEVDDVVPLLATHAVVVLTSDHEGTPLSLLEAMAAGRAVVTTAVGGIPDIVVSDQTGCLEPAGDMAGLARRMDALVHDGPRAAALGQAAQRDVQARFGAGRLAADTAALYERVLGGAKG